MSCSVFPDRAGRESRRNPSFWRWQVSPQCSCICLCSAQAVSPTCQSLSAWTQKCVNSRLDYILASAGISPPLSFLCCTGCSSLVFCSCKSHGWASSYTGAAQECCHSSPPQSEQDIPQQGPERLPAFASFFSGASPLCQESPEIRISLCRRADLPVASERLGARAWGLRTYLSLQDCLGVFSRLR